MRQRNFWIDCRSNLFTKIGKSKIGVIMVEKIICWIDTKENIHYFITAAMEEKTLLEMAENIFEKN